MKRILFVVSMLMVGLLNAQSKKEQIEILNKRVDSLNQVVSSERKINQDKSTKISELTNTITNLESSISLQDSLNELIRNKLPLQEVYSYSFDRIYSDEIKEHLKKLVVKYPTYSESDDRYYTRKNTTVLDTRLFLENNKMKALLITLDRIPINNDTRPQLNINFFIIDCQNINKPSILYNWSSLLPECIVDYDSDIIDVQFTDLNNDGNVEVWAVNEKFCMGGVDLTELLIFKYENGKHCTLESMTNSHYIINPETNASMDDDFIRNTHEKEPLIFDQCFSNSDAVFINYAKHLREKNIYGKGGFRFIKDGYDNPKFWSREDSDKEKIVKENNTGKVTQTGSFKSVKIGAQTWMSENLNVSTFRNGDPIPEAKTNEEWEKAGENKQPAWCYYDNDPANGAKYGKLYNWYAVNDPRGLAPVGYHVPSDAEWTILTGFLGGQDAAGTKMKSKSGWAENRNGTNSSGFSGLPGGGRYDDGAFSYIGTVGDWWSSTEDDAGSAWGRYLGYGDGSVYGSYGNEENGFSVRCLRD